MNESIKIDSVFLSFGPQQVLRGINLEFNKHQVTGILGRNGCGKSCLLKIITGQIKPQSKHLAYEDKVMDNLYREKGLINYLPQHEFHPKLLTLKKLLSFYEIDQEYFLGQYPFLSEIQNSRFSKLSGGERRIIEVLLILEASTKFSILDEPFTHVMPKYVELIKKRILDLKAQKGILITDHQYQNVMDISDKTYLISAGTTKKVRGSDDLKNYGYIR